MKKENENNIIFIAYNYEHIQVFKATQSFKQVFTIFNNPVDEIDINNETENIEMVKNAIKKYVQENDIQEYKCFMQF